MGHPGRARSRTPPPTPLRPVGPTVAVIWHLVFSSVFERVGLEASPSADEDDGTEVGDAEFVDETKSSSSATTSPGCENSAKCVGFLR